MPAFHRIVYQTLLLLAATLSLATTAHAIQVGNPVVLEQNGIRISLGANFRVHGQIKVDGIPFTDQSRLYALRPNAGGRFFGYEDDIHSAEDTKVTTATNGTVQAIYPLRAPNGEFTGSQVVELTPDRTLRFNIDGAFHHTGGRFEHRAGGIYTGWLSGNPFKAVMQDGTTTHGVIPSAPHSENLEESTVIKGFKSLTVISPIGPIEITTSGTLPVRLQDYRRNRYFDAEPLFWLGVSEMPAEPDQHIQYGMQIHFPPPQPPASAAGEPILMSGPTQVTSAYKPRAPQDVIVPTPKKLAWGDGVLEIPSLGRPNLKLTGFSGDEAELLENLGLAGKTIEGKAPAGSPEIRVTLTSATAPLEHYHLKVADAVDLTAETTQGIVAGVQSLRQLTRNVEKEKLTLRRCEIDDYASLPFRCIHFFAGGGDSETHIKLIQQLLAPLKLNELCYHADNLVWKSHPEIKNPAGNPMPADEVRKVVDAASRAYVDVVPLVASFGHSDWLLTTPELRKLADNPDFPYAYDPTKPEVYNLVEDLYNEAIDLFHPRYFHIGHDEVDLKGFPQQERLKKIGLRKLFADDVKHYRDFFAARGIRTIIWGDELVGPGESPDATLAPTVEEAKLRRESLPKDVIIADWHYVSDPAPAYKSLQILNEAGFDTCAVTWMHPLNVVNFMRAGADANSANYTTPNHGHTLGIIQSTWSGSKTNDEVVRRNSDQYACYVLAAEAAWNGGSMQPDQLPYDFRQYFSELWLKDMLPKESRPGWRAGDPQNPVQLACQFARAGGAASQLPAKVSYPILTTASLLMFDVTASSGGPADPIATATIQYDDGTSQSIEWKIGYNVLGREDKRSMPGALLLNPDAPRGEYIHRYIVRANPSAIEQITFASTNQGPGLAIHSILGTQ